LNERLHEAGGDKKRGLFRNVANCRHLPLRCLSVLRFKLNEDTLNCLIGRRGVFL
jgi:hypothetical protein